MRMSVSTIGMFSFEIQLLEFGGYGSVPFEGVLRNRCQCSSDLRRRWF
jgi:hypothetical protein